MPGQKPNPNAPVQQPFQGLFLDRPSHTMVPSAFDACLNVRIERGRVRFDLTGHTAFPNKAASGSLPACINLPTLTTDYPLITYYAGFPQSNGDFSLIYGTPNNLYSYQDSQAVIITPIYNIGTASASGTAVTGVGSFWTSPLGNYALSYTENDVPAGSTSMVLGMFPLSLRVGQVIYAPSAINAIPPGTIVTSVDVPSRTVTWAADHATTVDMPPGTTIAVGVGGLQFRAQARAGDLICFGKSAPSYPNFQGDTLHQIASVNSNTSITLTASAGSVSSGSYYILQTFSGLVSSPNTPFGPSITHWEGDVFPEAGEPFNSDVFIAVNGSDPTFAWTGVLGTSGTYRVEVPFIAGSVRRYNNLMLYANLIGENGQNLGTSMANSDNGVPTTMAGGVAGQYVVTGAPGYISSIGILGSSALMYVTDPQLGGSVVSASYVGFPTNFAFSTIVQGRGPIGPKLVAEFPDRHQFLAKDGMYRYNGLFIQVMNDHIWREVLQNIDYQRIGWSYCAVHPFYGDLIWAVPLNSDPAGYEPTQFAYVEHYMEQANSYLFKPYTFRSWQCPACLFVPLTQHWRWEQFTGAWTTFTGLWSPSLYDSNAGSNFAFIGTGGYAGGTTSNFLYVNDGTGSAGLQYCQFPQRYVAGSRLNRGLIKRVWPEIDYEASPTPLTVNLALFDRVDGQQLNYVSSLWTPDTNAGNGQQLPNYVTFYNRGRVAQVRFDNTLNTPSTDTLAVLDGYDWDVIPGGQRGFNE